jgi:flavin-dependent dehydrogenase
MIFRADVLVAGAGVAGCVAAAALQQAGARVICVEHEALSVRKIGEHLPVQALHFLEECELATALAATPQLSVSAKRSRWGSAHSVVHAIESALGPSLIIDRLAFEDRLRKAIRGRGVTLLRATQVLRSSVSRRFVKTTVRGKHGERQVHSRWVIDCTGRANAVSSSFSSFRNYADKLVAVWRVYPGHQHCATSELLVESVADGWVYSSLLPSRERLVAAFTDNDLPAFRLLMTEEGWRRFIEPTVFVSAALTKEQLGEKPSFRSNAANSSRLPEFCGAGWAAAGDAACTFDPLSSQGMMTAMSSGINVARAICEFENDDRSALVQYSSWLEDVIVDYQRERTRYYALAESDYESPFWRRRDKTRNTELI